MASSPLASVGILSIGEMGLGVAKLLSSHNYRVLTNVSDRSPATHTRARSASISLLATDAELVNKSDYILSIVPPRDALKTAERIASAYKAQPREQHKSPLYFLDLNAISPRSARAIGDILRDNDPPIRYIDGGIIGGAPRTDPSTGQWTVPSIPTSGPHPLHDAPASGSDLFKLLNGKHVSAEIGTASGLKCSFASLTKGFAALAIQSFSTAHRLGVLEELQSHLAQYSPKTGEMAKKSLPVMPPKAYRWVAEMHEIAQTFRDDGGWNNEAGELYDHVADIYRVVAEDTILGKETTENRVRGTSAEDVAEAVSDGLRTSSSQINR